MSDEARKNRYDSTFELLSKVELEARNDNYRSAYTAGKALLMLLEQYCKTTTHLNALRRRDDLVGDMERTDGTTNT